MLNYLFFPAKITTTLYSFERTNERTNGDTTKIFFFLTTEILLSIIIVIIIIIVVVVLVYRVCDYRCQCPKVFPI